MAPTSSHDRALVRDEPGAVTKFRWPGKWVGSCVSNRVDSAVGSILRISDLSHLYRRIVAARSEGHRGYSQFLKGSPCDRTQVQNRTRNPSPRRRQRPASTSDASAHSPSRWASGQQRSPCRRLRRLIPRGRADRHHRNPHRRRPNVHRPARHVRTQARPAHQGNPPRVAHGSGRARLSGSRRQPRSPIATQLWTHPPVRRRPRRQKSTTTPQPRPGRAAQPHPGPVPPSADQPRRRPRRFTPAFR